LKSCDYKNVPYCIAKALLNAADGNMNDGFAFAGSNAYRATKMQSVKEIMDELKNEYNLTECTAKFTPNFQVAEFVKY
jgi:hypothetical protein